MTGLLGDLQRAPLRLQIAERLHVMIDSGLLRPGDELPGERELASMLDVSRESVRGAIQTLAARGVLNIAQGSRTRVSTAPPRRPAGPDNTRANDAAVFAARAVLEPALASAAATRLDAAGLAHLQSLVEAQGGMLDDAVAFQISDEAFHTAIFAAAGNPVLFGYARETYAHAYAFRREVLVHADGIAAALADHRAILAALQARDPVRAGHAMGAHVATIAGLLDRIRAAA